MVNHCSRQKVVFFIGIILLAFTNLTAQADLPDYEFISTIDGFPKRGITAITTDEQGFVWIGTYGAGLYKYDGIKYTSFSYNFQDSTSISSNIVNAVYKDKNGQLWIGTDAGLNLYDRALSQFSTIRFDHKENGFEKNIDVVAITEDSEERILLGCNNYGLFIINPETQIAVKRPFESKQKEQFPFDILNFATSASGMVYAATNQGLKLFDAGKGVLIDALIHTESGNKTLDVPLSSLLIDDLNNLWIGSQQKGIYKTSCLNAKQLSLKYLERFPTTQRRGLSLANNRDGHIFCGTENDGLFILGPEGQVLNELRYDKKEPKGIKSNSIWEVFFDAQERLWVGYYDKGVDVYDPNYRKFNHIEHLTGGDAGVLSEASITGLAADAKGNIWFGTDGNGLHYWNKSTQTITPYLSEFYQNKIGVAIQTVFIDSKEDVWAGSWDEGIFLMKKGQREFVNFTVENTQGQLSSNRILSFAEDSEGTIWFGTWRKGIHSYSRENQQFKHHNTSFWQQYGLDNYDIRKILVDENDQLWIGSTKGLFKIVFDSEQNITETISFREKWADIFKEHISFNSILSLYKSQSGDLWFGTDGAGLFCYQILKDSLLRYNPKNGMAQQSVSAIVEAGTNQIWVSGRSGLSHLNIETGEIKNYSKEDGLISNDFNNNSCYAKCPYCQLNSCSNGPNRRSSFYHQSARPDKGFKGAVSVLGNRHRPFETL